MPLARLEGEERAHLLRLEELGDLPVLAAEQLDDADLPGELEHAARVDEVEGVGGVLLDERLDAQVEGHAGLPEPLDELAAGLGDAAGECEKWAVRKLRRTVRSRSGSGGWKTELDAVRAHPRLELLDLLAEADHVIDHVERRVVTEVRSVGGGLDLQGGQDCSNIQCWRSVRCLRAFAQQQGEAGILCRALAPWPRRDAYAAPPCKADGKASRFSPA